MKPLSPCKDCEKRHIGCHSECEDFIKYRQALGMFKKNIKTSLRKKDVYEGYQKDKKDKFKEKKQ